ncbi:MAG TPA: hypothetical protein ENH85_00210 [Candidatus Scalindua sp.]|nr:hypothetical protein [Candidatus Scalindua sp.]
MCIGLVDTEASYCSIPGGFAKDLGLDLESGKEDIIGTGNGKTKIYLHNCKIDIYDTLELQKHQNYKIVYTIQTREIPFLPKLPTVLLGANGFLMNFILTIDYPNKLFSILKTET